MLIYNYFGKYCTAMTIAHKTKSKVTRVFRKYGDSIKILDENNDKLAEFGKYKSNNMKKQSYKLHTKYLHRNVHDLLITNLKLAKMSMVW